MANPKIYEVFNAEEFSRRLRHLRVNMLDMQISEFADKAGIAGATVRHYEHGRCMPGAYAVFNICKTYGVSADWLLGLKGRYDDGK